MKRRGEPKPGDRVTAKRAGWNEQLDVEQSFDMEPYEEKGYTSDDLRGILEIVSYPGGAVYLVGGQEADPETVRAVDDEED